jgi:hypothetical protein
LSLQPAGNSVFPDMPVPERWRFSMWEPGALLDQPSLLSSHLPQVNCRPSPVPSLYDIHRESPGPAQSTSPRIQPDQTLPAPAQLHSVSLPGLASTAAVCCRPCRTSCSRQQSEPTGSRSSLPLRLSRASRRAHRATPAQGGRFAVAQRTTNVRNPSCR